ncbi:MAG: hypothetical protein AAFW46_02895 [Pseudomonadota bacterium]
MIETKGAAGGEAARRASSAVGVIACVWALALAAALWSGVAVAQGAVLGGAYDGIDDASGWRIELTERLQEGGVSAGYEGVFIDRTGARIEFEAFPSGPGGREAETRAEIGGRSVFMRFSPRPIGLVAVWIPVSEDDRLVIEETRSYPFVREGTALPEAPDGLSPPPQAGATGYDPLLFLLSYEFWRPNEVGDGYTALEDKWRTLIRLYAEVHTDILWKLCQARTTPPGLVEALEGQNVTCQEVLAKLDQIQSEGKFSKYKADLAQQKTRLVDAVKCARGQLLKRECLKVNAWTNRAALSLDSAKTVLARY